eukprot:1709356-Prymnesium_polylepis.1
MNSGRTKSRRPRAPRNRLGYATFATGMVNSAFANHECRRGVVSFERSKEFRERASLPSLRRYFKKCSVTCPRHAPARQIRMIENRKRVEAVRLFMRNSIM